MEPKKVFYPQQKSGAQKGLENKQAFIKETISNKENSIKESAIKRDSALFASLDVPKEELVSRYEYWLEFFRKQYYS